MVARGEVLRALAAVAVVALVMVVRSLAGTDAVLFPEVGALAVGLLLVDKNVWRVSKAGALVVMSLAATIGVAISILTAGLGVVVSVPCAFLLTCLLLSFFNVPMYPALAAALMPQLFGPASWCYVGVVVATVGLVLLVQLLLERVGARRVVLPGVHQPWADCGAPVRRVVLLTLCAMPLVVAAWLSGWVFMAAPPLLVTLVEFAQGGSGFRKRPWQVLFMLFFGAMMGSAAVVICSSLGLGYVVAGTGIMAVMVVLFSIFRKSYAPAATVALLAMLVEGDAIWAYSVQIAIGGAYAIVVSSLPYLIFPRGAKQKE